MLVPHHQKNEKIKTPKIRDTSTEHHSSLHSTSALWLKNYFRESHRWKMNFVMKSIMQRQLSQKQPSSHKTDAERKPERRPIKECLRLPILWFSHFSGNKGTDPPQIHKPMQVYHKMLMKCFVRLLEKELSEGFFLMSVWIPFQTLGPANSTNWLGDASLEEEREYCVLALV